MTILICLVAGMSSRFGGLDKPKQLEKVGPNDETLIEYSINQATTIPLYKIVFITNKKTEINFKNIFGSNYDNIPVSYIRQNFDHKIRKKPWGTLDAICCAVDIIDRNFIVINGDDIYGTSTFKKGFDILNNIGRKNVLGLVKTLKTLPKSGKVNRGIATVSGDKVIAITEKLNISIEDDELHNTFSNVNFLCFQPEVIYILLKYLNDFKDQNKDDDKIEILLPDILNKMLEQNEIILDYFEIENNILGITNPADSKSIKKLLNNL